MKISDTLRSTTTSGESSGGHSKRLGDDSGESLVGDPAHAGLSKLHLDPAIVGHMDGGEDVLQEHLGPAHIHTPEIFKE